MLNIVMADLLEGHPISEKKMKEVLGHTPLQVRVASGALQIRFSLHYRLQQQGEGE